MSEINAQPEMNAPALLLVEDDENDFELLALSCKRAGLSLPIQWVDGTHPAIQYLKGVGKFSDRAQFPFPTLVLIDLKLPGDSGFEVLKWIRQQPELQKLLVWVYSGSLEATDASKAYQLDANAYVVKPKDLREWTELTRSLDVCLWRSRHASNPQPSARL